MKLTTIFVIPTLLLVLVTGAAICQELIDKVSELPLDTATATVEVSALIRGGYQREVLTRSTLYVLNQPHATIPLLADDIKGHLSGTEEDKARVNTAAELIAYATSEASIDAFADLAAIDPDRFLPFVATTFTYAIARQRDFDLAAYAAERYPALAGTVKQWLANTMKYPRADEMLAAVVLQSEEASSPSRSRLQKLVQFLEPGARSRYNDAVVKVRNWKASQRATP